MKGCVDMNIGLLKRSMEYQKVSMDILKEYSIFMDKYFLEEKNINDHKELYLAYEKMLKEKLKREAEKRGLIK